MIEFEKIVKNLNDSLNENIESDYRFKLFTDGGEFKRDEREYTNNGFRPLATNQINRYVNGLAKVVNSSITVVNGLKISQTTVSVEMIVPINEETQNAELLKKVKNAITLTTQTATTQNIDNILVSVYGTEPMVSGIEQRQEVGTSVIVSFNMFYSFIQNGISSLEVEMFFNEEKVHFTELTVSVTPVMEGGALSNTNGSALNYVVADAMQISVSVPALKNNYLTKEFISFLLKKTRNIYSVKIKFPTGDDEIVGEYEMIFSQSNLTARGIEGVGNSITLVEALKGVEDANL